MHVDTINLDLELIVSLIYVCHIWISKGFENGLWNANTEWSFGKFMTLIIIFCHKPRTNQPLWP